MPEPELDDMEKAIADMVGGTLPVPPMPSAPYAPVLKPFKPPSPAPLQSVEKREPTLSEQLNKMEAIGSALKGRMRREQLSMQHDYELQVVAIRNDYERRISDAIMSLEKQRDGELRALSDTFNDKAREHDLLSKRMGA